MNAAPLRMTREQADELAARGAALRIIRRPWTAEELQLWRDYMRICCHARGCSRSAAFVYHTERRDTWGNLTRFTFLRCENHPHPTGKKFLAAYLIP